MSHKFVAPQNGKDQRGHPMIVRISYQAISNDKRAPKPSLMVVLSHVYITVVPAAGQPASGPQSPRGLAHESELTLKYLVYQPVSLS